MEPVDLVGTTTNDGWFVERLVTRATYQSGGHFSHGYIATKGSRVAFLKSLDFSIALRSADPPRAAEDLLRSYNFERDVLALCRGAGMSKVVTAISDGSIPFPGAPFESIYYLLFELADGDLRKYVAETNSLDPIWRLRALHQISVGLSQLHGKGVFHQDLKPSNVLVFEMGTSSKLADLGRAHCRTIGAPHDVFPMPGATAYAPPEQLYSYVMPEQLHARAAADLYLLGSMIFFMFTGSKLTPFLIGQLRTEHRPPVFANDNGGWLGTFAEVMPFLREAFAFAVGFLADEMKLQLEHECILELKMLFKTLADPQPESRGHPAERRNIYSAPYNLQRYISSLNLVASRAEVALRRNAKAA